MTTSEDGTLPVGTGRPAAGSAMQLLAIVLWLVAVVVFAIVQDRRHPPQFAPALMVLAMPAIALIPLVMWGTRRAPRGVCAVLAFTVAYWGVMLTQPPNLNTHHNDNGCKSNLKNLGTALEMYSNDFEGRFPTALQDVTPNYLKTLPSCLAAPGAVYAYTHSGAKPTDAYTLTCAGRHGEKGARHNGYSSITGLIEVPASDPEKTTP